MKYRNIFFALLLAACSGNSNNAETRPQQHKDSAPSDSIVFLKADTHFIKKKFPYKGKIRQALKWKDRDGIHIAFTCQTGVYYTDQTPDNMYRQNAELYCYHYAEVKGEYALKWKIYDYSLDCFADAMAKFCRESLDVTDLDKDGVPEIWTMYKTACRSDVSPSTFKVIMYEGDVKHKLEGKSRIKDDVNGDYGGEIEKTLNFEKSRIFMDHARKKWDEHVNDMF